MDEHVTHQFTVDTFTFFTTVTTITAATAIARPSDTPF
jgi:hypothetical protein